MIKITIVTGSTRPARVNDQVAKWAYEMTQRRYFEPVDIAEYHLPLLDEQLSPLFGKYAHDHTKRWSEKIASFDGYVW